MTPYRPGDVVLVPFPFTDLTTDKQRPGVVISSSWYNQVKSEVILVAITSTIHDTLDDDEIIVRGIERQNAGLPKDSIVMSGIIFTLKKNKIIKPLGRLNNSLFEKVMAGVKLSLAFRN